MGLAIALWITKGITFWMATHSGDYMAHVNRNLSWRTTRIICQRKNCLAAIIEFTWINCFDIETLEMIRRRFSIVFTPNFKPSPLIQTNISCVNVSSTKDSLINFNKIHSGVDYGIDKPYI